MKTKTWAELGYWHKMCITSHWFNYSSGRGAMSLVHKIDKEKWRVDGQTCRKEDAQAFAGQHAPNSTSYYIFDEASEVPDEIYEVRNGGLTDGEPMAFDFGNPIRNTGYFYENCAGKFKDRYIVRSIDSRDVQLTNKEQFKEWIDDYGIDSDYVKVRVLGQFPTTGSLQFIPSGLVDEAIARGLVRESTAPVILGVDVARFGDDDSVIFTRIGRDARTWVSRSYHGLDTVQLAGRVIEVIHEFQDLSQTVAATYVDGTGVGGGVVDNLRNLGYNVSEVQAGSSPIDNRMYALKTDECWGRLREALQKGEICLPNDDNLRRQLTQRFYGHNRKGKIQLESKKDMKSRGIESPDLADALSLTYAQRVLAIDTDKLEHNRKHLQEFDPIDDYFKQQGI